MKFSFSLQDWNNPASNGRIDLVFEDRGKDMGAYLIRKEYERNLLRAFLISFSVLLLACSVPFITLFLVDKISLKDLLSDAVILAEPPPIDKMMPPPQPVVLPPPVAKTIKFTPPKIVKDMEAEEPPPTQQEMENIQISSVTQEGSSTEILPEDNPVIPIDDDKVFSFVEEMPSFPGGENKMMEFILANVQYPVVARENNVSGKVYVKFIVDKQGKIMNPELMRGIGGGCDEEAIRILNMMPDWNPGRQNGHAVKVGGIVLHIDFKLR